MFISLTRGCAGSGQIDQQITVSGARAKLLVSSVNDPNHFAQLYTKPTRALMAAAAPLLRDIAEVKLLAAAHNPSRSCE